jgi:ABC-type protease/lipase transport system fused ATPase/permease subunit
LWDDESGAAGSFSQFALGSVQAEGEVNDSRRCQILEDMLNSDEFDGADAYTGKMLLPWLNLFLFVHFIVLRVKSFMYSGLLLHLSLNQE